MTQQEPAGSARRLLLARVDIKEEQSPTLD